MAISSFFHFENVRAAFRERYLDIRQTIRTATFLPIERRGRNVRLRAFIYVFFLFLFCCCWNSEICGMASQSIVVAVVRFLIRQTGRDVLGRGQ